MNASSSRTVTFNLTGVTATPTTSIGGIDFTASALSCNGGFTVCTASVTFVPKSPGLKQDALLLKTSGGSLIASAFLHGIGVAPALRALPAAISTLAGNGNWSYVDGSAASSAFRFPQGLAIDLPGNIYVADSVNQVVRKIAASNGAVSTYAGNGSAGFSGDNGPARNATMNTPTGVALDPAGNLYIADQGNGLIRRVDAVSNVITTVAGGGNSNANGVSATTAALSGPNDVALDTAGNIYLSDSFHNLLRKVTVATGLITTIAGGGTGSGNDGIGDGGPATASQLSNPTGLALDDAGNIFFADTGHSMIRCIDAATGIISAVAGTGANGSMGDGGPALDATLASPSGVRLDANGNIYIADLGGQVVRFVNATTGLISTLAGNGIAGYTGNGGAAVSAELKDPTDLAIGVTGSLSIADYGNNVVRKVSFQPPTLTFPATNQTLTSPSIPVTIANYGNATLALSSLAVTAPFQQTASSDTDCSATSSLSPGASCQILLVFVPTAAGSVTGTLTVGSNDSNRASQLVVNLAGTGLSGTPVASLSPTSLTFPNQPVGSTSSGLTATLRNTGNASLPIATIAITGVNSSDFNINGSNCASTLAAGATCTITLGFSPRATGARTATLQVTDSAASSPQTLTINGTGTAGAQPILNKTTVQFGSQLNTSSSASQVVTLSNSGITTLGITGIYINGVNALDFTLYSYTCGSTLAPSASCTVTLRFIPTAAGSRAATLVFDFSGGLASSTVALAGTGLPLPCVTSINTSTQVYMSAGGSGTLTIAAGAGCSWTAVSNASWIVLNTSASGNGNGTVAFTVSATTISQPRIGTISVGSLTASLNQTGIGLRFVAITPCRVVDTRNPSGPFGGPSLDGINPREFDLSSGSCGIPTSAQAYSLNVAIVPKTVFHNLTIWPSGQPEPLAANLNSHGQTKSNAAIVPAGLNGGINVDPTDPADLILDINGYYVAASSNTGLDFYPLAPCRVVDTRLPTAPLAAPFIPGGGVRNFPIRSGSCGVPSNAQAYSMNFAAIPRTRQFAYLTAWPAGGSQPTVSTLNGDGDNIIANAAIVKSGTNGAISVYSFDDIDLVIDINGYFAPAATGGLLLYNVNPCRALDTRLAGAPPFVGAATFNLTTNCPIPSQTRGYVLQVAVVPSLSFRNLSLWPGGTTQPLVATLNDDDGKVTSNLAIVPTNNGQISASPNVGPAHLILDIFGLFAP